MGVALDTQVAGVANIGIGVANSGLNAAVGNLSSNGSQPAGGPFGPGAVLGQSALIGSEDTGGTVDITGIGPVTANNAGEASNTSDGTARVGTGNATASGNVSSTDLSQHQTSHVTDGGLALATQVGGVANVGVGVANSGLNEADGNASTNAARSTQEADVVSGVATPTSPITVIGPLAANNSGQASNSSDGEACVCTGDATASGNLSSTTLVQDLDTSVGSGVVVLTEAGGVLNAGVGLANSGLNLAEGNTSTNTSVATQTSTINDGLDPGDIVGPQIAHNGGGATNSSDGTGKVGSGRATATGNQSSTNLVQAAAVDSDFAVATLAGGTTNTGLGLANSGLNLALGNDSTNDANLTQTADGAGIVSNDGTADNSSDGTAIVGNPDCLVPPPIVVNPPPPGIVTLPKTGGPLEAEAVFGLMLLLAGFALRRKGNALS
jgi:hypothetical protein